MLALPYNFPAMANFEDNSFPGWLKALGVALLVLTGLGLFYAITSGSIFDLARDLRWWMFLLVLPLIGLAGLLFEGALELAGGFIFAPFIRLWRWIPRWL